MAKAMKKGATRKPVRKAKQTVSWRKQLRQLAALSAVLLFVAGIYQLRQSDTLPIRHVTVEGKFSHVEKDVLVKAVGPYTRGGFLSIDVARIRQEGEALPWVKTIQVRRIWPDRLHLIVEEQIAVAHWKDHEFLNDAGEKFSSTKIKKLTGLVVLEGPENSHRLMTKRYLTMVQQLKKHKLSIKRLVMDERRAWKLVLNNEVQVVLGRANSEMRFKRFITMYQHDLQHYQAQIAEMDMRYTNGFSVVWKSEQKPDFNGTV